MKTTIDLSDALFEQAKAAAKAQGVSLRTLVERGLQMAIRPREAMAEPELPDLVFRPPAIQRGALADASAWRDLANESPMPQSMGRGA